MKMIKMLAAMSVGVLSSSVALAQAAPSNQTAPALEVGAVVYDPQGGEAAKIDGINGNYVVINTGTNKATLPRTSFGKGPKGPVIGMTSAQLDAAVSASLAKSAASLESALVPGAEVLGKAGAVVGNVKEIVGEQVVLEHAQGAVSFNKKSFAVTSGKLTLLLTASELEAAIQAAKAGS